MEQLCLPMDLFHVEKELECYKKRVASDGKEKNGHTLKAPHPSRLTSRYEKSAVFLGQLNYLSIVSDYLYHNLNTILNLCFSHIFHVTVSSSFLYHALENTAN